LSAGRNVFPSALDVAEAGPLNLVLFDMVKRHSSGCERSAPIFPVGKRSGGWSQIPGLNLLALSFGAGPVRGAHVAYGLVLRRV
jgi:hypothetical protein